MVVEVVRDLVTSPVEGRSIQRSRGGQIFCEQIRPIQQCRLRWNHRNKSWVG